MWARVPVRRACTGARRGAVFSLMVALMAAVSIVASPVAQAAPAVQSAPTLRVFKLGSKGHVVRRAQRILGVTPATGFYGAQTAAAVRRFQRAHGLPATGVMTARTWRALKRLSSAPAPAGFTVLQFGMTSPAVTALQAGLRMPAVTGYFGSMTLAYVKALQRAAHLRVTGIVDKKTWSKVGKVRFTPPVIASTQGGQVPPGSAPAPAGYWITPGQSNAFYSSVLAAIGAPATATNLKVMDAWARAEGSTSAFNPWNTTQRAPGCTVDSNGSTRFADWPSAVAAQAAQLLSLYQAVVAGFVASNASQTIAAIVVSPWASGHYYGATNWQNSTIWRIYNS